MQNREKGSVQMCKNVFKCLFVFSFPKAMQKCDYLQPRTTLIIVTIRWLGMIIFAFALYSPMIEIHSTVFIYSL